MKGLDLMELDGEDGFEGSSMQRKVWRGMVCSALLLLLLDRPLLIKTL